MTIGHRQSFHSPARRFIRDQQGYQPVIGQHLSGQFGGGRENLSDIKASSDRLRDLGKSGCTFGGTISCGEGIRRRARCSPFLPPRGLSARAVGTVYLGA